MTKRQTLTLDDHRWLGAQLALIRMELGQRLTGCKKTSKTARRIRRAINCIIRLREELEDLLVTQHSEVASPYYQNHWPSAEGRDMDWLYGIMNHEVPYVINGKVPAAIADLYLRCDRTLSAVKRDEDE